MPWHIAKSARCPAARPWAVVTTATGRVNGCHPTKAAAQAQLAALNAQGVKEAPMGTDTQSDGPAPASPELAPTDNLYRAISPSPELLILRAATDGDEAASASAMPVLVTDFIVFRAWTEIDSFLEGRFMEQIDPKAVARTFREDRSRMRVLFQHGRDPQIGDKPLGPIDTLEATGRSATAEVPLLDTAYNRELIPGLAAGLYGASFRFRVFGESWNKKPARSKHNPEGLPERTINEIEVREFGPVTFPAYDKTTAGLRSSDASSDSDGVLPARTLMRSVTDDFLAPADVPAAIVRAGFDPARVAAWATGATASSFSGRPSPWRAGGGESGTEPDPAAPEPEPGEAPAPPEPETGAPPPDDGEPPAREPAPPGSRRARARDRALRLRGVL